MASKRKRPHRGAPRRSAPPQLGGLTRAIGAVASWLAAAKVGFAVVGGVAASLHGRPRVTKDVDVVVLTDDSTWEPLLKAAARYGLHPRIEGALEFARITRVLLLVHRPTNIEVDASFGMLPFEAELVARARTVEVGKISFPLASAEDIIVMKALALRPRDVADIEGIVESMDALDFGRIRETLSRLSAALETEDHVSRLDEILRALHR